MTGDIIVGLLAFLGGGLGAALAFLATSNATSAEREARRREEWGRRFTAALEALTSEDARRRATGRALLVALLGSELAGDDDRVEATAVLEAAATHSPDGDLRMLLPIQDLDQVDIVRDTDDEPRPKETPHDPTEGLRQ